MSDKLFIAIDLGLVQLKECARCGSTARPIDEHHITYIPKKKVYLCRSCHIGITVINGTYAQRWSTKVNNYIRRKLFRKFMKCKWRMEDEDESIIKLRRRRNMVYKNRLKKLQKEFFHE